MLNTRYPRLSLRCLASSWPGRRARHCGAARTSCHPEDWSVESAGARTTFVSCINKRMPDKIFCIQAALRTPDRRVKQHRSDLQVLLVGPEIPQNAGNIARTCAATSVGLHLVKPLGFEITDRKLKRAGLDYWPFVVVHVHDSWQAFSRFYAELPPPKRLIGYSKFAEDIYSAPNLYRPGDWLMFGAETSGLPPEAKDATDAYVKIPMVETHVRSLNLATSVGIGLFEAIRQLDSTHCKPAVASGMIQDWTAVGQGSEDMSPALRKEERP